MWRTYLENCLADANACVVDQNSRLAMRLLDLLAYLFHGGSIGDIELVEVDRRYCDITISPMLVIPQS